MWNVDLREKKPKTTNDSGSTVERLVMPDHGQTVKIHLVGGGSYPAIYNAEYDDGVFVQNGIRIYPKDVESWEKA